MLYKTQKQLYHTKTHVIITVTIKWNSISSLKALTSEVTLSQTTIGDNSVNYHVTKCHGLLTSHSHLKEYDSAFEPKEIDKPIPNSHLPGFVSWDHSLPISVSFRFQSGCRTTQITEKAKGDRSVAFASCDSKTKEREMTGEAKQDNVEGPAAFCVRSSILFGP